MPAYTAPDAVLLAACELSHSSTHSPGGQHRNKTESAVRLRHRPSGLEARCDEHRERADNRAAALLRLRLRLAIQERGSSDPAWLVRLRRGNGLAVAPEAPGFAQAVACCLDALASAQAVLGDAARALELSTNGFTKVITADKEVLQAANEMRRAAGLRPIRPVAG